MKIHCKYTGIKGFVSCYNDALRYAHMITKKALERAKTLAFFEKHGLKLTQEAFGAKRSTIYLWKQVWENGERKIEALNDKKRTPKTKRRRLWDIRILNEIRRLREIHPNLGEKKIHPLLWEFCIKERLICPKPITIGRLIQDMGGLRMFPKKISHFGRVKKVNRQKILRKPKDFEAQYPGHLVALDTVERFVDGCRRYILTFEDIYTRFSFAWATNSHASLSAKEFFDLCLKVFPYPIEFVLTDNGSEFKKHFSSALKQLYLTHFHTYPKTPKMNAHVERFNRTIQEEFVDYHSQLLKNPDQLNRSLIDYLIFYNTQRVHYAFKNKLSPLKFMLEWSNINSIKIPLESRMRGGYTITVNSDVNPIQSATAIVAD